MDSTSNLSLFTDYAAAPAASAFHTADATELEEVSQQINDSEQSSLQTEWARAAWELDRECCNRAQELIHAGHTVFVAQDEDGFYFATEQ